MDIKEILRIVESKIAVHKEFRSAYNKQYAFDFNLFNFFGIDENKVTAILAYFLNPEATHGQGDLFLKEFINMLFDEPPETGDNVKIRCEELTNNGRRIDLYIELEDFVIGIENKLNAEDQKNQLADYAQYLNKQKDGRYKLLYLNTEGTDPCTNSIDVNARKGYEDKNQFGIISYRVDISDLLDRWAAVCEADNVSYFIKQFKRFLITQFIDHNTLKMENTLKPLILENIETVTELVIAYEEIEREVQKRFEEIRKSLVGEANYTRRSNLEYHWEGPFPHEGGKACKLSIWEGTNKLFIQLIWKRLGLFVRHYFETTTEARFKSIAKNFQLLNSLEPLKEEKNEDIIILFWEQVVKVEKIFEEYQRTATDAVLE